MLCTEPVSPQLPQRTERTASWRRHFSIHASMTAAHAAVRSAPGSHAGPRPRANAAHPASILARVVGQATPLTRPAARTECLKQNPCQHIKCHQRDAHIVQQPSPPTLESGKPCARAVSVRNGRPRVLTQ